MGNIILDEELLDILDQGGILNKSALLEAQAKRERVKYGDSGYTPDTLAEVLPSMRNQSEALKTDVELQLFTNKVTEVINNLFGEINPLTDATANKWIETMEEFFTDINYSKEVLTTLNYKETKFGKKYFKWNAFRFCGEINIVNGFECIDAAFTTYMKTHKLITTIQLSKIKTRDIWIEAKKLAISGSLSPIENYLADSMNYWRYIDFDSPKQMMLQYTTLMNKKYDKSFINFMESTGHGVLQMWRYYLSTPMGALFTEEIAKFEAKYRKNPKEVRGIYGFQEHINESTDWNKREEEAKRLTAPELYSRRKRQGGSEVLYKQEAKRFRYPQGPSHPKSTYENKTDSNHHQGRYQNPQSEPNDHTANKQP